MKEYDLGVEHGLTAYAFWKDGRQYVGTSGIPLSEAIAKIPKLWNYDPPAPAAVNLEDMEIGELVELIEEARRVAKDKQANLATDGGCSCHLNPPCSFCVAGGSLEIP